MIVIVDYGLKDLPLNLDELKSFHSDLFISNCEVTIAKAEKIILPSTPKIKSAVKQLHILNLFSILRMLQKPILGIGTSMQLMCEFIKKDSATCLGMFELSSSMIEDSTAINQVEGDIKIKKIKPSLLLNNIGEDEMFYLNTQYFIPKNILTTSVIFDKPDISASIEKDNFFAVQFDPFSSGNSGKTILKNFINL